LSRWKSQWKRGVKDYRVWVVVVMLAVGATLHYAHDGHPHPLLFLPVPVSRHALDRVLLILPTAYSAFTFGLRGGLATLSAAVLIMVPRVLFISPHPLDAAMETAAVTLVGGLAVWLVEIQERVRRLREKALAEAQALNSISAAITQSLQLEQMLDLALQRIAKLMKVDISWVYLLDEEAQELVFAAQRGLSETLLEGADRLKVGEGLNGWVAQSGQPLGVENISEDPRLTREAVRSEGVQGFLAVPLKSKDKVIGTLGVAMFYPRHFSSDEIRLLSTIGNQIGVAIENVRLYEREREIAAQLRTSAENLRSYVREITRAQEEERKRIARELHDDTAQALALLSRRLDTLSTLNEQMPKIPSQRLEELRELTDSILQGLRRFSRDLRPPVLDDLGLLAALKGLTTDLVKEGGTEATLEVIGSETRLSPEAELVLFRIAQEALNNVKKHSGASKALITVEFDEGGVGITVRDNGKGFELPDRMEDLAAAGKLGLIGMQERARLLGGSLTVQSRPAEGTTVVVTVPS